MTIEWALFLYTVLSQLAVGTIVMIFVADAMGKGGEAPPKTSLYAVATASIALATVASLFHLANPMHAPFTIFHLTSSWLSREILFTLITGACSLIALILRTRQAKKEARLTFELIGTVCGVLLVLSTCMSYLIPAQPAWNTLLTPLEMFGSILALGSVIVTPTLAETKTRRIESILGIIGLAIIFVAAALKVPVLSSSSAPEAAATAQLVLSDFMPVIILAVLCCAAGIVCLAVMSFSKKQRKGSKAMVIASIVVALCGIVALRFLFYAAHVQVNPFS